MNNTKEWYRQLRKPPFAPPSWVFGPVWSVLYLGIAISFTYTAYESFRGAVPLSVLGLFVTNLVTNLVYSPIQFRLRDLVLASVDIVLVLVTLIAAITSIHSYIPWVAWINVPYLLWVSFATILQFTITGMNRDRWSVY